MRQQDHRTAQNTENQTHLAGPAGAEPTDQKARIRRKRGRRAEDETDLQADQRRRNAERRRHGGRDGGQHHVGERHERLNGCRCGDDESAL